MRILILVTFLTLLLSIKAIGAQNFTLISNTSSCFVGEELNFKIVGTPNVSFNLTIVSNDSKEMLNITLDPLGEFKLRRRCMQVGNYSLFVNNKKLFSYQVLSLPCRVNLTSNLNETYLEGNLTLIFNFSFPLTFNFTLSSNSSILFNSYVENRSNFSLTIFLSKGEYEISIFGKCINFSRSFKVLEEKRWARLHLPSKIYLYSENVSFLIEGAQNSTLFYKITSQNFFLVSEAKLNTSGYFSFEGSILPGNYTLEVFFKNRTLAKQEFKVINDSEEKVFIEPLAYQRSFYFNKPVRWSNTYFIFNGLEYPVNLSFLNFSLPSDSYSPRIFLENESFRWLEVKNKTKLYLNLHYETPPVHLTCEKSFSKLLNITCTLNNSASISYFNISLNLSIREGYSNFSLKVGNISASLSLFDSDANGKIDLLQVFFLEIRENSSFNFSIVALLAGNETDITPKKSYEIEVEHVCKECVIVISVNKTVDLSLRVFSLYPSKFIALIPTDWLIRDKGNSTLIPWNQKFNALEWNVAGFSVLRFSLIPRYPGTYNFSFFFLNDSKIVYSKDYQLSVSNQTLRIPTLTYKLNSSVEEGIVLEGMENVIFDCDSFSVRGEIAILVKNCKNVSIRNCRIENSEIGILFYRTHKSFIQNNTLLNNKFGIVLFNSNSNLIEGNDAFKNKYGIILYSSERNTLKTNKAKTNFNPIEFLLLLRMIFSLK